MVYYNEDGSITSNAAPRTIIGQTAIDAEKDAILNPLPVAPQGWQPIETAPKDGTRFLGWNAEFGWRQTFMKKYGEGSPGFAKWKLGDGPLNCGWDWCEPYAGFSHSWQPTHWMPLPAPPADLLKRTKEGGK